MAADGLHRTMRIPKICSKRDVQTGLAIYDRSSISNKADMPHEPINMIFLNEPMMHYVEFCQQMKKVYADEGLMDKLSHFVRNILLCRRTYDEEKREELAERIDIGSDFYNGMMYMLRVAFCHLHPLHWGFWLARVLKLHEIDGILHSEHANIPDMTWQRIIDVNGNLTKVQVPTLCATDEVVLFVAKFASGNGFCFRYVTKKHLTHGGYHTMSALRGALKSYYTYVFTCTFINF